MRQITNTLMMVRPANFGFNTETAESNAFQVNDTQLNSTQIKALAVKEFDEFVNRLRKVGIHVIVVEDSHEPAKTDAVFPNNWISFHEDGTIITYPMLSEVRRLERRPQIINQVGETHQINRQIAYEEYENQARFLEGTGSLILDRPNKIAYACRSERTNKMVLEQFCEEMGYTAVLFDAVDGMQMPIYHTNVMMAVGKDFVVICMGSIPSPTDRTQLLNTFSMTGKTVIEITLVQMMHFAGNMLQVQGKEKDYLVMSEQAYQSLNEPQIEQIKSHTNILYSPLKTIETYGGGSARCMMAEVFLPIKQ